MKQTSKKEVVMKDVAANAVADREAIDKQSKKEEVEE
jgi:hypothetical protein